MALAFDLANPVTGTAWVAPGSGAVGSRAAVLTEFEQRRLLRLYRSLGLLAAVPHEFAPQVALAVDLDATQGRHDWPPSALAITVRARQGQLTRGAGGGVGPWLRQCAELPPVHDLLDDGEQVEGRAGKQVDPCHRHHVAGVGAFSSFNSSCRSGRAPLTLSWKILAHPSGRDVQAAHRASGRGC